MRHWERRLSPQCVTRLRASRAAEAPTSSSQVRPQPTALGHCGAHACSRTPHAPRHPRRRDASGRCACVTRVHTYQLRLAGAFLARRRRHRSRRPLRRPCAHAWRRPRQRPAATLRAAGLGGQARHDGWFGRMHRHRRPAATLSLRPTRRSPRRCAPRAACRYCRSSRRRRCGPRGRSTGERALGDGIRLYFARHGPAGAGAAAAVGGRGRPPGEGRATAGETPEGVRAGS